MTEPGRRRFRGPIAWMAKNRVAANLLMIFILAGGVALSGAVEREVFPEIQLDRVVVSVVYPGATPEEVEEGIVLAVEEATRGVDGVEEVRSIAREGQGEIVAEIARGADADQAQSDIESAVDRITSFPLEAEEPIVALASNRSQVISLVLYGDVDLQTLRNAAENARDALLADDRITQIEVTDIPPPEIHVEVPQERLREHGLTLQQIAERIAEGSVDVPAGALETPKEEVLIRTTERRETGAEIAAIELITTEAGGTVTVGDVARVRDAFRDIDRAAYFNGERAARVDVYRVGDESPLEIADAVHEYVEGPGETISDEVSIAVWNDTSEIYDDRIGLLVDNAILGVILVIIILGLFLDMRVAFWVTLGIPISFLGAFFAMAALDVSLNMITLFAFILTLGIVVDDAIVAGEAIHARAGQAETRLEAAIAGVHEIAGPIVFAVLTTIIAFTPMLFVPGASGELFDNIPLVVIPILVVSLVEAFFILPAHLGHGRAAPRFLRWLERIQQHIAGGLERFIDRGYQPAVRAACRHRYVSLTAAAAVLAVCVSLITSGWIPFRFLPSIEGDVVTTRVEMPFGTATETTRAAMDQLVDSVTEILEDTDQIEDARGIYAVVGQGTAIAGGPDADAIAEGGHLAAVAAYLPPPEQRTVSSEEIADRWRAAVGEIPGVESITFEHAAVQPAGDPVAIELRHDDEAILERAADELAATLRTIAGSRDVDDGFELGKPQLELELTPAARAQGITELELGRQVRNAFFGAEAVRQQRGRLELRVYVRRPPEERASVYDVEDMVVATPEGGEIPLSQAARIRHARSFTSIERVDGRRSVAVTADVDEEETTAGAVTQRALGFVEDELEPRYPGLTWEVAGEQEEQEESLAALGRGIVLALIAMYALMAVAFRSYVQPVVIMVAIPFGLVGALAGHLLLGFDLSLISLLGLIALSGVVVNDSLVLVAAVNDRRDEETPALEAVVSGGMRRFRPILLTSLTTFFGLVPMIFETSLQARFLIPMALSLGFGVLFVTVISLFIVPCAYLVVDDVARRAKRASRRVRGRDA